MLGCCGLLPACIQTHRERHNITSSPPPPHPLPSPPGAVAVRLRVWDAPLVLVCSHLASGEAEGDEAKRNADYAEICKRCLFPRDAELRDAGAESECRGQRVGGGVWALGVGRVGLRQMHVLLPRLLLRQSSLLMCCLPQHGHVVGLQGVMAPPLSILFPCALSTTSIPHPQPRCAAVGCVGVAGLHPRPPQCHLAGGLELPHHHQR
jgi:hypothetical protein